MLNNIYVLLRLIKWHHQVKASEAMFSLDFIPNPMSTQATDAGVPTSQIKP